MKIFLKISSHFNHNQTNHGHYRNHSGNRIIIHNNSNHNKSNYNHDNHKSHFNHKNHNQNKN